MPHDPNGSMTTNGRLLAVWEVAAYLGLHPKTIYRLVASKRLPCVRIGLRLRFDPKDITRWVSAQKEE
jgi:excisionase family DNA binding protein